MTPTQEKGIVHGKRYIVSGMPGEKPNSQIATGDVKNGSILVLNEDDESPLPYFDRIAFDGEVLRSRCIVDLTKVTLTEEKAEPLKNYIIEVSDVETTVRVGKILSADQLKRIIEILGE